MGATLASNNSVATSPDYSLLRDKGALAFLLSFLVAFAVLLQFNFSDIDEQIAATEREQSGLDVSIYLRDLLTDLQDSRGYSDMFLSGDGAVLEKIAANHHHMEQDIENYASITGSGAASLHIQRRWDHLSARIKALRVPKPGDSSAQSFADHTAVIDELLGLLHYVGDTSGVVYEDDNDANHLVNFVLIPMPILVEYVAKMRGLSAGAAARHGVSADERKELQELRGSIKAGINRIEEISDDRYEGDKKVVDEIKPRLNEALSTTHNFIGIIQSKLIDSGSADLAPGVVYDAGSLAMNAYLKFFDRTVSLLDAMLQQRIQAQTERRYAVLSISGVIVLMVLSGLYFYARSRAVRARAEQALQNTLSKLNLHKYAIDEHAIVSIADRRGIITYVNNKFCAISKYAAEELIGQNHNILNSACHSKAFFRELWTTIGSGKVWSGEICNRGKNGELYWVQSTIIPRLDATGQVSEYISIRTDITEQKLEQQRREQRAERLQRRNELLHGLTISHLVNEGDERTAFRTISQAAAVGLMVPRVSIWLFDDALGLLECAYQYCETVLTRGMPRQLRVVDYPHYVNVLKSTRLIAADDAAQDPRTYELAGSHILPLGITAKLDATVRVAGRVMGVVCSEQLEHARHWNSDEQSFATAIADMVALVLERQARNRAEAKAHERERRFAGLVENMTDLAWELDAQARITYCSGNIEQILGYRPDEIMTRTPFELMPPEEGERIMQIFTELAADQKPIVNLEHMNLTKDGRLIHMISNGIPLRNAAGDLTGYLGVASDVTARIAVEQERQSAHEAVLRASQAKSEFLAMMSHEIRTPMNGVMGMLQILQATPLDPIQRDLLTTAQESSGMLLNMLNTILDFSKATTGRIDLDPVEFDPCDLVEAVTHPLLLIAQERCIALSYICAPEASQRVCGDVLRLRQVLTNLLSNALKFTERGSITVHVVMQKSASAMKRLRFEVVDTGIGVDAEAQARIFGAFEQADSSTTRRYGGSGLGLALCKQLVELMGGEISMTSSLGQGSVFAFEVPVECRPELNCDKTPTDAVCGSVKEETVVTPRPRVLVVDDNKVNRRVAKQMLMRIGCDADEAVGGVEALDRIAAERYDLVLLDCQMPDIDGYEVAMRVRASEVNGRYLPIVAMTADAMVGTRQRCLDAGMDDYFPKPLDIKRLTRVVKTQCGAAFGNLQFGNAAEWGEAVQPKEDAFGDMEALRPLLSAGFETMVSGFVNDSDACLDAMIKALAGGDTETLISAAHTLKGSAGNLGLMSLSRHCEQVLAIARGDAGAGALASAVDAAAHEFARLRDGLRRIGSAAENTGVSASC
jgi:PAS domain S-box-containing protein